MKKCDDLPRNVTQQRHFYGFCVAIQSDFAAFEKLTADGRSAKTWAMIKIIMGVVFVVGGLSGNLVLIGTNSGVALAAFGGVLIIWGIIALARKNRA